MLPESGTFKLTLVTLKGWVGHSNNPANTVPNGIARYQIGTYGSTLYSDVEVTFNGNTITWDGGSATLTDPKYLVNPKVPGEANSAIYTNTQEPGTFVIVSKVNAAPFVNGQTIDHHFYDRNGDVYAGNNHYAYGQEDNFSPCFLAGTLIKTPSGMVKVEDLRAGDEVITCKADGSSSVDTLTWVGKAKTSVHRNTYGDKAGYPVRILKDAIADGVPFKDLLVTSEHCLFFDGKFIPARMLVNGSSISYDTSFTSYEYFHIETEKHSVIIADGMLTESYLDTGNRRAFLQEGPVFFLGRQEQNGKTWENDAAAPLTVARAVVEPIYRQIEARAHKMQFAVNSEPVSLTEEMDLCLRAETGQIIRPARKSGDRIVFMIPEHVQSVRIVSNTSRPCDIIGPFVDDRREFGVLVGEVSLFTGDQTIFLTEPFQNETLNGWQKLEKEPVRWTNGDAFLPLADSLEGPAVLALQIVAAGPYLVQNDQGSRTMKAA